MTTITFKGNSIKTVGSLPQVGNSAPDFVVTKADLSELNLSDLRGHKVILNIFPSLDTPVCAMSVQKFSQKQNELGDTQVICISADLPFAANRFCEVNNIKNAVHGSVFRHPAFGQDYGVTIAEGPLRGLLSRAVVVLGADGRVLYTEQVAEVTEEPNYDAAIAAVK